ncbi:MAG: DMT family transporter [Deltaproteobacteria bacterium]|nr:DMT family transporter [Deltaproteobacteria bacterium]
MSTSEHGAKGLLAVLMGATVLGFAALLVKWAGQGGASDVTIGFYRMLMALPGAFVLAQRSGGVRASRAGILWACGAGAAFFSDLWLWHLAMHHTGAANATLLVGGLSPLWVALFAVIVLRHRLGPIGWLGQAIGFSGAVTLAIGRGAQLGLGRGELIAVVASFFYASFTLCLTQARLKLQAPQALFWTIASCLGCFLVAVLLRGDALGGFTPQAWGSLVALGLVIQLFAWWFNTWGLGHVAPAVGAIALQMQQVATLLLAWVLLGEAQRPLALVGAAGIFAGILLVAWARASTLRTVDEPPAEA